MANTSGWPASTPATILNRQRCAVVIAFRPQFSVCDVPTVFDIWAPLFIGFSLERFDYTLHSSAAAATAAVAAAMTARGRSARGQVASPEPKSSSLHMHSSTSLSSAMKMHHQQHI
jgi:hypothetical protein